MTVGQFGIVIVTFIVFREREGKHKGGRRVGDILSSSGDAIEHQLVEVFVEPDWEITKDILELPTTRAFA